jgi:hypothetical protein
VTWFAPKGGEIGQQACWPNQADALSLGLAWMFGLGFVGRMAWSGWELFLGMGTEHHSPPFKPGQDPIRLEAWQGGQEFLECTELWAEGGVYGSGVFVEFVSFCVEGQV